ncbi:hypothetical protein [Kitasatospora sp. NPDC050543]|uniref:hypothetical protein n=1 Tax=Kitasatospora sp. NPDC050543 TaxID=3364054 RepID=UPI003791A1FA
MKHTNRDNFRVQVSGTIDLPAPVGPRLRLDMTGVIHPQRLGDFGWVSMSDSLTGDNIQGRYEERCREIVSALAGQYPGVKAEVVCDSRDECSHCGLGWEVWTAEDAARWPDESSVIGEPACCEAAQAEFYAAKAVQEA